MKNLTADAFDGEVKSGNSLVFFHRLRGCPNCERMLPAMASFEKPGVTVYEVDADAEKDIAQRYAPSGQWQLPLIVYMEEGKAVSVSTGVIDQKKLMDLTRTLQNISNDELYVAILDSRINISTIQKNLHLAQMADIELNAEREGRLKQLQEMAGEDTVLTTAPAESPSPATVA